MEQSENIPEVTAKNEPELYRWLKLLFKIIITGICLWYVSSKINFRELSDILMNANWYWLILGLFLFSISKIIASRRLNLYFNAINIRLSEWENIRLFWLGMFYNLFLPGSVTGDAYKVILLKKKLNASYKKTTAAVLLDRFSGLLALGVLMAVYGVFVLSNRIHIGLLIAGSVISIAALYFITKKFFHDFIKIFPSTFFCGMLVQVLMIACIYAVLKSLDIETSQSVYIFIFLAAAVVAVLPLTVGGGLGIREFVFLEGAVYFGVPENTAVAVSILFYCITLLTSLPGAVYAFKNPLQDK